MFGVIRSSEKRGPMRRVLGVSENYRSGVVDAVHLTLDCGHIETVYVTKGTTIKARWIECETCGGNGQK